MDDMKVLMKCLNKSNIYYISVTVEGVFLTLFLILRTSLCIRLWLIILNFDLDHKI